MADDLNVDYTLPIVQYRKDDWQLIEDCIAGERRIKEGKTTYLPAPNPDDLSEANLQRYAQYVKRAVFYNVTKRTHSGLTALAFVDPPQVALPTGLDVLLTDINGAGLSFTQQMREALDAVAAHGRYGLLVDYPPLQAPVSKSEIARSTSLRPFVRTYKPWEIINWDEEMIGAKRVPSLVVLRESYKQRGADGYSVEIGRQWRVLRLTAEGYAVTVVREAIGGKDYTVETFEPQGSNGKRLLEIPFVAVGSTNNDLGVDDPPMLDIANMNIAHYRNSADYEESVFMCGQMTPVITGVGKEWWENVLHKTIRLGSRAAVPLPAGADLKLLQAEANGLVREAMQDKERQMVALGARLIQSTQVQRTATEARIESASEMSILSLCASNVSAAYTKCMEWAGLFAGVAGNSIIELHPNAELERLTAEERAALIADLQEGTLSFAEVRAKLRAAGLATEDDEQVKAAKVDKPSSDPVVVTTE